MMLFALAALIHGSMLFGRALLEHAVDMTGPADETVKAAVDGKPVFPFFPRKKSDPVFQGDRAYMPVMRRLLLFL